MNDNNLPKPVVMPFGKYKGKPVESLMQDESYIEWLTSQDWFKQKFQNIYTVIINKFREVVDTPEHNRMQVKFLDETYRLKVAYKLHGLKIFMYDQSHFDQNISEFLRKAKVECRDFKEVLDEIMKLDGIRLISHDGPKFEEKRIDVLFEIQYGYGRIGIRENNYRSCSSLFDDFWKCGGNLQLKIELKPSVGDDFPGVLRQMKADKSKILVFGSYNGSGANEKNFIEYFTSQNIAVLSEVEIENTVFPNFDEILIINPESEYLSEFFPANQAV